MKHPGICVSGLSLSLLLAAPAAARPGASEPGPRSHALLSPDEIAGEAEEILIAVGGRPSEAARDLLVERLQALDDALPGEGLPSPFAAWDRGADARWLAPMRALSASLTDAQLDALAALGGLDPDEAEAGLLAALDPHQRALFGSVVEATSPPEDARYRPVPCLVANGAGLAVSILIMNHAATTGDEDCELMGATTTMLMGIGTGIAFACITWEGGEDLCAVSGLLDVLSASVSVFTGTYGRCRGNAAVTATCALGAIFCLPPPPAPPPTPTPAP